MELSLRLDTLEMVEMRYLRHRDRYRDWPSFQLLAASRQAKIMAYMTKDVAEQLHQQILIVESAVGLDEDEDGDELDEDSIDDEPKGSSEGAKSSERDSSTFSPAFAQALERRNDLARQRLPEGNVSSVGSEQPIQVRSFLFLQGRQHFRHGNDFVLYNVISSRERIFTRTRPCGDRADFFNTAAGRTMRA